MAISQTITGGGQFPESTSVGAYPRSAWGAEGVFGAPTGSATDTKTVTGGQLAFTGLANNTDYIAYAQVGGVDRYRRFSTREGSPPSAERRGVFDVTKGPYNAAGDGVTDDRAAIQAAVDACKAAGGGTVYLPAGTYKITSVQNGLYGVFVDGSNITIQGSGPSTVIAGAPYSGGGGRTFLVGGLSLVTGRASWASNQLSLAAVKTMNPATKGARTVTLSTPADAGNFAVGDWAYIRTGECIGTPGAGQITEPDAEINQIIAADAGTGVLTLKWPLAKSYAQEYYQTGTSGQTTTTVTANPAPLGVADVTDRVITNVAFRNLRFADTSPYYCITGGGLVGLTLEDISGTYISSAFSFGDFRNVHLNRLDMHGTGGGDITYVPVAFAKGSGDVWMNDLRLSSDGLTQFHIAEGTFRHFARAMTVFNNPASTVANDCLNFSGRGYDLDYDDISVYGGSSHASAHAIRQTADVKGPLRLGRGIVFHDTFGAGMAFSAGGVRYIDRPTRSGLYYAQCVESVGAVSLVQNAQYLAPQRFDTNVTLVEAAINVTTAAAANVLRVYIYGDNYGWPGPLIAELPATFDLSTTGVKTQVISIALEPGDYWTGGVLQGGTGAAVSGVGSNGDTALRMPRAQSPASSARSLLKSGVTGAVTDPLGLTISTGAITNICPMVTFKAG